MEGGNFLKEKLDEEKILEKITREKSEAVIETGMGEEIKKPHRSCSFVRNWGGWLIGDE